MCLAYYVRDVNSLLSFFAHFSGVFEVFEGRTTCFCWTLMPIAGMAIEGVGRDELACSLFFLVCANNTHHIMPHQQTHAVSLYIEGQLINFADFQDATTAIWPCPPDLT